MSPDQILATLLKHPALLNRVGHILEIIDNKDGHTTLADDAQDCVIKELREFGNELLSEWAKTENKKAEATLLNSGVAANKKSKKIVLA